MNQPAFSTLGQMLENSVRLYAEKPALAFAGGATLTYRTLGRQVGETSAMLRELGILAGDRVAILSENMPNWGIAFFAVTSMGAVAVPILPEFHENEIRHILQHSGCRVLFVSDALADKAVSAADLGISVIRIHSLRPAQAESGREKIRNILSKGRQHVARIREAAHKIGIGHERETGPDDIASIIYTSGTTGHSKGVMLTHGNLVSNTIACSIVQDVHEEDQFLSILPLSHAYENTVGFLLPVMQGACIHYLEKPPTPSVLIPALAQVKPTVMLSVPLIIEKIVRKRVFAEISRKKILKTLTALPAVRRVIFRKAGRKLMAVFGGRLRFFGIGGAAVAPDVEAFLREAGFPYAVGYGLTETSPLATGAPPEKTRFQSAGRPVQGAEVRINDPDPQTGEGEIWIRGPLVMKGYYRDPERTAQVLTPEGWFKTGDLGYLDKDEYLFIRGRLKNVIVRPDGENIYPEEIESALNACDYVLESLVFRRGEQLVARVLLDYERLDRENEGRHAAEQELLGRIKTLLEEIRLKVNASVNAFSRIHTIIEQTEPFEKTPTQKIKRYLYVEN
ncbi:AMP-binding protein [bacterium]|nr:AMP-binding protein [bacterium]